MARQEAIRLMAEQPVFWSRLGFCYDPPRANAKGEQIVFNEDFEPYRRLHEAFTQAGVTLHTGILHSGWVGDGRFDYRLTDRTVEAMLAGRPERWYIPRIKLNAPVEWCKNHPEEVCVYYGGPSTPEGIARLVDTPKHDWFGGDCPGGYPVNGGHVFRDDRPNVDGEIALQSFSSKRWLRDAGEALARLIEHLENGPWGRQILAYQVAFGCCGETVLWGAWRPSGSNRRGDWGIGHRRAFYDWVVERYGTKALAQAAYGLPDLSPDRLPALAPLEREYASGQALAQFFYADAPLMPDYHAFLSEKTAEAIEHFGKVVHERADKPVGAFYGYLVGPQAAYAGHLAIDRILNSEHIDFLCSPRAYQYSAPGEPGGEQAPSRSYNRKKLWLDELDNWTHLDKRGRPGTARNMAETLEVLRREVAKNITSNQGFWWMDLYDGWYDDPEIMREIAALKRRSDQMRAVPHRSVSEVLLLVDEDSIAHARVSYGLSMGLRKRLEREVRLCGAPIDLYRLKDLDDLPIDQYKVIVFLNAFYLPEALRRRIMPRLPGGATLIWNYAPGILAPQFDMENVRALTGFSIEPGPRHSKEVYDDIALDFPPLRVSGAPGVQALLKDEGIVCARRTRADGGVSVLAAEPCLRTDLIRKLLAESGVTFYAGAPRAVYADNRMTWIASQGPER